MTEPLSYHAKLNVYKTNYVYKVEYLVYNRTFECLLFFTNIVCVLCIVNLQIKIKCKTGSFKLKSLGK